MRSLLLLSLPLLAAAHACPLSPPPPSKRPCWDQTAKNDLNRDPDGNLPPGGEDPDCDSKGHFLPKQCSGSQCYCVEPSTGNSLASPLGPGRYSNNRWEADDMKCHCAAEEAKTIGGPPVFGDPTPICDDNGNYHHTQCTGSQCYCVHRHTGEEISGTNSDIVDREQLETRCAKETP